MKITELVLINHAINWLISHCDRLNTVRTSICQYDPGSSAHPHIKLIQSLFEPVQLSIYQISLAIFYASLFDFHLHLGFLPLVRLKIFLIV